MFVRSCRISILFLRVLGFIGALLILFIFFGRLRLLRLLFIDTFHFILKLALGSSSFLSLLITSDLANFVACLHLILDAVNAVFNIAARFQSCLFISFAQAD